MITRSELALISLYTLVVIYGIFQVNHVVPQPYMDEIFHVPQTQKYCQGDWLNWDPKITTFPGLYVYSVGIQYMYSSILPYAKSLFPSVNFPTPCSTEALRWNQVPLAPVLAACLLALLRSRSAPHTSSVLRCLVAAAFLFFPPLFFYNFLFYTDQISMLLVLLTYLSSLQAARLTSYSPRVGLPTAFFGTLSILCRQTNIVWLFFSVASTALFPRSLPHSSEAGHPQTLHMHKKKVGHVQAPSASQSPAKDAKASSEAAASGWSEECKQLGQTLFSISSLSRILIQHVASLVVALAFLVFVKWNGGIVVGDRESHVPVVHWVQVFYCAVFILVGLCIPALCVLVQKTAYSGRHTSVVVVAKLLTLLSLLTGVAWWVVRNYTLVHPFILSDNRHYIFYIRSKLGNWAQAASPAYAFALLALFYLVTCAPYGLGRLQALLLFGCICLALVPAALVEFRYFLVPAALVYIQAQTVLVLGSSRTTHIVLLGQVLSHLVLSYAIMYIFLYKPYIWGDGSVARFMF